MTPFRRLRQILRCLDVSLVNVLYDVLMFHYISVTRCSDGRQVDGRREMVDGETVDGETVDGRW